MNCPKCGAELRIGRSYQTVDDASPVTVQEMMCPNSRCSYNRAGAPVRINRTRGPSGQIPAEYEICCDQVLAKIDQDTYFVPEGISSTVAGDELTVTCPACGTRKTRSVAGKTAFRA